MPLFMNTTLATLNSNSIHCSFCAVTLLDFISGLVINICSISNHGRHDSAESFISECVEVVFCSIIQKIIEHGENRLQFGRESYLGILFRCKIVARNKRKKRQMDEKYLGNCLFANEIHRSYDEFIAILVSTLRCNPLSTKSRMGYGMLSIAAQ